MGCAHLAASALVAFPSSFFAEASMDQTAELQLAAEMGQLLISQKRELMQELDVIKGKNTF